MAEVVTMDIEIAIKRAFAKADEKIMKAVPEDNGCTVAVCLIDWKHKMLYSANCGDARVVVRTNGRTIRLSKDHKGSDSAERDAVIKRGGFFVPGDTYVNNLLAISRALGDKHLKPYVSAEPLVVPYSIKNQKGTVIVACDGLWDIVEDAAATNLAWDIVCKNRENPERCTLAANALIDGARGTKDNVSVIVCEIDTNIPVEVPVVEEAKKDTAVSIEKDDSKEPNEDDKKPPCENEEESSEEEGESVEKDKETSEKLESDQEEFSETSVL
jgi:protein phosphatase PTC1